MANASNPDRERVRALRELDLLDTPPEAAFDALVREASVACEVPIAVVSLVDEDRQWFKAKVGVEASETPRDVAFCHYAVMSDDAFVVPDAATDPRFQGNPLVTGEPSIRFYAGMPLRTPEGYRVGTICVIDRRPRELDAAQSSALARLRDAAEELIARRRR